MPKTPIQQSGGEDYDFELRFRGPLAAMKCQEYAENGVPSGVMDDHESCHHFVGGLGRVVSWSISSDRGYTEATLYATYPPPQIA